jgi:hypothetical protein
MISFLRSCELIALCPHCGNQTSWRAAQSCLNFVRERFVNGEPGSRLFIAVKLAGLFIATPLAAQNMGDMGSMDMSHRMTETSPGVGDMTMHDANMDHGSMKNMALHMTWSDPRPANAADQACADKLVATLRKAISKYKDYRVAEADGFKPLHPEI